MKYLLVALLLSVGMTSAVPAPWGIALNNETIECAGFWAGDEFTYYSLPAGWKAYYPFSNGSSIIITTPAGKCDFAHDEESCCNQLNLTYVTKNIGQFSGRGSCEVFGNCTECEVNTDCPDANKICVENKCVSIEVPGYNGEDITVPHDNLTIYMLMGVLIIAFIAFTVYILKRK